MFFIMNRLTIHGALLNQKLPKKVAHIGPWAFRKESRHEY
jgi:hypothetical protein